MAKTISPVCKLCRREGEKLYLKGERCFTPKCSFEKRSFAPGQHGRTAGRGGGRGGKRTGESDFARQLRISRSGITISAALAAGYRREDSARFSFLLSTPVIGGAALLKLRHITFQGHAAWGCVLGVLSAAVVGYLAIRFLIRYLGRHSLNVFVWYRLILAGAVIALWAVDSAV